MPDPSGYGDGVIELRQIFDQQIGILLFRRRTAPASLHRVNIPKHCRFQHYFALKRGITTDKAEFNSYLVCSDCNGCERAYLGKNTRFQNLTVATALIPGK